MISKSGMTKIFPALQCGSAHPHHERGRDWFEAEGTLSWHAGHAGYAGHAGLCQALSWHAGHVGHAGHAGHTGHAGHAGLCQAFSWHAGQVFGLWQAFDHSGFEFCFPRFLWSVQILFDTFLPICNKYFSVLSVLSVLLFYCVTDINTFYI